MGDAVQMEAARRSTVIYDGDCAFCRGQVERIGRLDRRHAFELVPRQAPGLLDRFPQLAEGDFNTGMRLITSRGQTLVGADAIYEIARSLPSWRWIAWIYRVPVLHGICRAAYAWVARNRMRLGQSCDSRTC